MPSPTDIIAAARSWTGTPYRHQASIKGVGCDCLGLVRGVWREVHGSEPEEPPAYAPGWAESGGTETLAEAGFRHLVPVPGKAIAPGHVLLFRWKPHLPAKHAAIAVAADRMIHAHDGLCVCEVSLSAWWQRRLAFVFRFPDVS